MSTETSTNPDTGVNPEADESQPLALKVVVKEVSACERHVTVTISRADIDRYFQKQFDELAPGALVPGFRAGRAPRKLIENRFKPQVSDQVKGALIMASLTQVSEEQDYSAISEPSFDFGQVNIPDEGDMTYEFDIEVRPEFATPLWKGLNLERPEHEFTTADIDDHIEKLGVKYSDLVPVDEPVQKDDVVVCEITCRHSGRIVSHLVEASLHVRPTLSFSDATVEDFDKLILGARADEKRSITVEVSEYSDNEAIRGQNVDIEFLILDVKRVEVRTAGEVAEKLNLDSEGALKDLIRDSLERQLQYAQREKIRGQISASLTESATWDLPPGLLRRQARRELERSVMEMKSSGFSEEETLARENGLRKNIMERTARLLKEHFILEKIAEDQSIEEEPGDQELEIARLAIQQNDSPRRIRARLERSGQMDALRNMIIERKVIDLITENATIRSTAYETGNPETVTAVNFFVAGGGEEIPEAKYADSGQQEPLPGTRKDRD